MLAQPVNLNTFILQASLKGPDKISGQRRMSPGQPTHACAHNVVADCPKIFVLVESDTVMVVKSANIFLVL